MSEIGEDIDRGAAVGGVVEENAIPGKGDRQARAGAAEIEATVRDPLRDRVQGQVHFPFPESAENVLLLRYQDETDGARAARVSPELSVEAQHHRGEAVGLEDARLSPETRLVPPPRPPPPPANVPGSPSVTSGLLPPPPLS